MIRIAVPRLLRATSFRLVALYVAVFVGSAFVLGIAVLIQARAALQAQTAARIESEVQFLEGEYRGGGLDQVRRLVEKRGKGATALDYLLQEDGRHLAGEIQPAPGLRPGWTTISVPQASEDGGRPETVRALVVPLGEALLAVGADLRQIDELQEAIVTAFLWTVGLAAVLGIAGGVLVSRAFLHRIDAIARTAEAIMGDQLGQRVPMRHTGDDLDRLAGILNRMLDRIEALMTSLRQVSSDVAHDLRTPLARLYHRLEEARAPGKTPDQYAATIDAAHGEAEQLLGTFSALLRIAQVEGGSPGAEFREVDLAALVESVCDAYRPDAEDAGHVLSTSVPVRAVVTGDRELLTQALANLMENALRHTPSGTRITVTLRTSSEDLSLLVEDDGPGVPEPDLTLLTDRFFRGERSRTAPGSGLGLSLVAAVAELHGAELIIANGRPGLSVMLRFPAQAVVR